jgi:mono/diheme cytochrome c family protein
MRLSTLITGLLVASVTAAFHSSPRAEQSTAQTGRSVLQGVYTEEQTRRGLEQFEEKCAVCHGDEMEGGEEAPSLYGTNFLSNWNGLTVGDLSERIRTSMPPDDPGRVSRQQNVDIVSAILKANGYPAGKAELETGAEVLKQIKIEPKK